jgi:hypothetical protein
VDRLRELQSKLSLEDDPVRKQELQEQFLELVQDRFFELVLGITEESDPERLRVLVAELDEIIEDRRDQAAKPDPLQAD